MITIKEVKNKRDLMKFIHFQNKLYKGSEYYCPAIYAGEISTFTDNPSLKFCKNANFLAYRDGKIVGRIAVIINQEANKYWEVKKARFGWFDFIDDYEVSKALLDTAAAWGREHGMDCLNGPVGFTDIDHQGLLIEGFEYDTPMQCIYNYPYYEAHYDKYGLRKDVDWKEMRVYVPERIPEKMERIAKIVLERYDLRIEKFNSAKALLDKFGMEYFNVYNQAYQPLYNFQALTTEQMKYYTDAFLPILNFDFVTCIVNAKDELIGFAFGIPDITKALRKCNGKMFPLGWFHIMKALKSKKMEVFDLMMIALRPEYQNKGINSLFFYDLIPQFWKYGVKFTETTPMLEDNSKVLSHWEYFETLQHKRRRAYIMNI